MTFDAFFLDTDTLQTNTAGGGASGIGDGFDGGAEDPRGTLLEVLDRLLDRGVFVAGDLEISVADVNLLFVGVKLVVSSVDAIEDARSAARSARSEDAAC